MIDVRSIAADIGVHLSDRTVAALERAARKQAKRVAGCCDPEGRNKGSWRCWLKNRLVERGYLRARLRGDRDVKLWVIMHVFNISRPDTLPSTGHFTLSPMVARSDIVVGHLVPRPIDKTAWRVAPGAPPPRLEDLIREPD